jgi:hypothetical protein
MQSVRKLRKRRFLTQGHRSRPKKWRTAPTRYGSAVSDSAGERPQPVRFVLTAPPPLRSLAISAVAAVTAAIMIVLGSALDLPEAVVIAGIALMIFAILLTVAAFILTARLRTTLILDAESITITRGREQRVLPWSMIDRVKLQAPRLLLIIQPESGGPDAVVTNPRGSADATFAALMTEIQQRLNADRGYRQIS